MLIFRSRANKTLLSSEFVVNGTALPDVPFDVGESYAGLLPISSSPDETRELYFWFFPSTNPNATNEITAWFNGGPGCSSLSGLLTENGPFVSIRMYLEIQKLRDNVDLGRRDYWSCPKPILLDQLDQYSLD
jgi:hypothetical protein